MTIENPRRKVIVIFPYKFSKNHAARLELLEFQSWAQVEIWELGVFFERDFYKKILSPPPEEFKILKFSTLMGFIFSFYRIKPEDVFFILNTLEPSKHWLSWLIFFLIHRTSLPIIHSVNSPFPSELNNAMQGASAGKLAPLRRWLRDRSFDFAYAIMAWVISFRSSSVYVLTGPQPTKQTPVKRYLGFSKPITGDSWEQSNLILESAKPTRESTHFFSRFAVLVDGAGPKFPDDRILQSSSEKNYKLTSDDWYPKCCNFFSLLEKKLGIQIIIAAHPKAKWRPTDTEFGCRTILQGETHRLIRESEFVMMRASTAIIAANFFQKPVFYIATEQLTADKQASHNQRSFQKVFGGLIINLDAPSPEAEIEKMSKYINDFSDSASGPAIRGSIPNSKVLFNLFGNLDK